MDTVSIHFLVSAAKSTGGGHEISIVCYFHQRTS